MASAAVIRATDPLRTPADGMMPEGGLKMTRTMDHPQGLAFGSWHFRSTQTPAQRQVSMQKLDARKRGTGPCAVATLTGEVAALICLHDPVVANIVLAGGKTVRQVMSKIESTPLGKKSEAFKSSGGAAGSRQISAAVDSISTQMSKFDGTRKDFKQLRKSSAPFYFREDVDISRPMTLMVVVRAICVCVDRG
jgi:hypothetical protein